jgi:large subunit ribosomal protein L11
MGDVVEVLVKGGHATAAPPLAPSLAPLGVNIGKVVEEINKKTKDFDGTEVPVKVIVNDDKSFKILVGTPPVSALIKRELNLEKGSGKTGQENVADMRIEQIIKIAKLKEDTIFGNDLKSKVKQVLGTCGSMGVLIEGKNAKDVIREINVGKYHNEIVQEKTELSAKELKELEKEKEEMAREIEERHKKQKIKAQEILESMKDKERAEIKRKMKEEGIEDDIIEELLPKVEAPAKIEPAENHKEGKKKEEK